MTDWKQLVTDIGNKGLDEIKSSIEQYNIYTSSFREKDGSCLFIARINGNKQVVITGDSSILQDFSGEVKNINGVKIKIADLNHENAEILRETFEFTNPRPLGKEGSSLGLGDRLGLASPGHIQTIKDKSIKPVLAQQSIRELNLTERTYEDVLDSASWAVFQEGYEEGFGADGDHLKTEKEIKMALDLNYTMLTLDCSEHINNEVEEMSETEAAEAYKWLQDKEDELNKLEELYLEHTVNIEDGVNFHYSKKDYIEIVLTYYKMLKFTKDIYKNIVEPYPTELDFEVSIDETQTPTTPQAHYFVAAELERAGINVNSLAPRFCGRFEKGIDYIGDIEQFEHEFTIHARIADHFGYKLSIHSGSDKFSVFPIIGEKTGGRVHVKTAGTNWLEAVRIIAHSEPDLYRELHQFALNNFDKATSYYHVTTDLDQVPDIEELSDKQLPELLSNNAARQLMHITYGEILQAQKNGDYLFKDRLYQVWDQYERDYARALQEHIGRHIETLGFE